MSATVSVLVGASGEYDDYSEWLIGVYMNPVDAYADCEALNALAGQTNNFDSNGLIAWGKLAERDAQAVEYGKSDRPEYRIEDVLFCIVRRF
jgi:hypothetical protein